MAHACATQNSSHIPGFSRWAAAHGAPCPAPPPLEICAFLEEAKLFCAFLSLRASPLHAPRKQRPLGSSSAALAGLLWEGMLFLAPASGAVAFQLGKSLCSVSFSRARMTLYEDTYKQAFSFPEVQLGQRLAHFHPGFSGFWVFCGAQMRLYE